MRQRQAQAKAKGSSYQPTQSERELVARTAIEEKLVSRDWQRAQAKKAA